jgi:hypothetical protein
MAPTKFVLLAAAAFAIAAPALGAKAHGCHYSCECGPPRGFGCEQQSHRHLHMLCLPVRCARDSDCERTPSAGACRHVTPR